MFIQVIYKDTPELSGLRRSVAESDTSAERTLLVNPDCPVRVMLEYVRDSCRLGPAAFDLCDDSGALKGLFALPTYEYATDKFETRRRYYVIVMKAEPDKTTTIIPQVNWDNMLYEELKSRVHLFLTRGPESSTALAPGSATRKGGKGAKATPPKATPPKATPPKQSPGKAR